MMTYEIDEKLREKMKRIKLCIFDVDGVLTDGRIIYDSEGREIKCFDVQDGLGVRLLKMAGIKTVLITVRQSKIIQQRARDMEVDKFYEGIIPKTKVLGEILDAYNVTQEEICFVGDDLVDWDMMRAVGFPVAVTNACREIKEAAGYVTQKRGGRGAVREIVELILKTQGKWKKIIGMEFGS